MESTTTYNNAFNTIGIGDHQTSSEHTFGSGDKFIAGSNTVQEKGREKSDNMNIHSTLLPYIVYSKNMK